MKKLLTFSLILLSGIVLYGCGKEKEDNTLTARDGDCKVRISTDNFEKGTEIIVREQDGRLEILAEGYENPRFDTPATVTFTLDEKVEDVDLDKWVGVYYCGDKEYYIEPNLEKLSKGKLEFNTYHFSLFGKKKLTDEELSDKFARQLATYEVMQEERVNEMIRSGNIIAETADSIYEELGITDETLRGKLVRDFVSELSGTVNGLDTSLESKVFQKNTKLAGYGLSGLELLNAAQDGDVTAFSSKIAGLVVSECCDHWNDIAQSYVPGAVGSIPEALYIAIEEGDLGGAAEHIAQSVVSNIPIVKYTQMTAELVDMSVNIWTDSEVELAYEAYSGKSAAGYSDTPDWDSLMIQMKGAYTQLLINAKKEYCEVNKISMSKLDKDEELCDKLARQTEAALKKQFETRKAKDDLIRAKEEEYQNIIKSFNSGDVKLMTRGKNDFDSKDDATFRLSRLMNIRNQVIELLGGSDPEHLYTIFGTRNVEKQNEMIADLVQTFISQKNNHEGKKAVIEAVKMIYDKDLTKDKSDDKDSKDKDSEEDQKYAWVLVSTEVETKENALTEAYRTTFSASENSHIYVDEYIGDMDYYEKATFTATFDSPPSIIYPDQEFYLHQSVSTSDVTEHYFYASGWYKTEGPDVHLGATSGRPKFEDEEGNACADASSREGELKGEEFTVIGTLGKGGNVGDQIGIFYCACGADTRWIYEWKAVQ